MSARSSRFWLLAAGLTECVGCPVIIGLPAGRWLVRVWAVGGVWSGSLGCSTGEITLGSHTGCGLWERQTSRQHTHILLIYYSLTTHILLVYCSYNCMLLMYYSCNTFHILSIYYSYSANTSSAHMLIIYFS